MGGTPQTSTDIVDPNASNNGPPPPTYVDPSQPPPAYPSVPQTQFYPQPAQQPQQPQQPQEQHYPPQQPQQPQPFPPPSSSSSSSSSTSFESGRMQLPAQAVQPPPAQNEGLFQKFERSMNAFSREASRTVNVATRKLTEKMSEREFQAAFQLSPEEHLFAEHAAKALTTGGTLSGYLYITQARLCFFAEVGKDYVKVAVPFAQVTKIQRGKYIEPKFAGQPAEVIPSTAGDVRADVIQIFTADMKIHQFTGFSDFDKAFSLLHYTWKVCQTYTPPLNL